MTIEERIKIKAQIRQKFFMLQRVDAYQLRELANDLKYNRQRIDQKLMTERSRHTLNV